jgi:hypothetical protein
MKRAALLVAILTASFAASALADESFILDIPNRFDAQQQIGEVRVVLGLNAAPAGAQLVVGGSTTLALGATQTVAGDSVAFTSLPNNRVMIRYRPLSNFGGDFCLGAAATDKAIPLRFVGAQDVISYRMSSFVVGAPAVECSDVARRIADMPATIDTTGDGVAPALSANNLGRLPIDVILVLDKSGSMADKPPGAGNAPSVPTKAAILRAAAKAFVANWRAIDAPFAMSEWSEDRIGIVFFDSVAAVQQPAGAVPPANFFVERGSSVTPGPWDSLISTIDNLAPGSNTSIGAGINAADQQWANDPAHDVDVVVVTDGMQNTAPLIAPTASGFLGLTPVGALPQELRKRFIPLLTVAFGTPASVDDTLLKNMSLETAGRSYTALDTTMMYDTFAMTLVSILKGNTASLADRFHVSATAPPPPPHQVLVDQSARRVLFSLQWAPAAVNALDFDVFRPGSAVVATPTRSDNLPQAALKSFDLGSAADIGSWSVRVHAPVTRSTTNVGRPVSYTLNVFFLERHLDYRVALDPIRSSAGKPLRIRAELSWDGKPLTRLPADAIRVRVLRPAATLASVLRNVRPVEQKSTAGDPKTDLERRIAGLTREDIVKLTPREVSAASLREEKRGVYSAVVAPEAVEGPYAFEVVLDWDDPRTGHIHRVERLEDIVTRAPSR